MKSGNSRRIVVRHCIHVLTCHGLVPGLPQHLGTDCRATGPCCPFCSMFYCRKSSFHARKEVFVSYPLVDILPRA